MRPKIVIGTLGVALAAVVGGTLLMTNVLASATVDEALGHPDITPRQADGSQHLVDNVAFDYAVGHLSDRYLSLDAIWLDKELREALPNVAFSIDGAPARPVYEGVVEGH